MAIENRGDEEPEYKPFSGTMLIKAMAILFVAAIYILIFLKIIFLR